MPARYDVFLSYHWRDQTPVHALAEKLLNQNLHVFLDRWYLTPGQPWPELLEQALATCGAVAVCIGPGEMGSWQQREQHYALDRQTREKGFPVIPVLMPGAEPPLGFIRQNTWVDFRTGLSDDLPLQLLAAAVRREPPDALLRERQLETLATLCPYRGLQFFREEDAAFLFGRDAAIATLYKALQQRPFIALVGPSGSGKSSVVRAGLCPKLRQERLAPWEIATLVPGGRPFHHLAGVLLPLLQTDLREVDRLDETAKLAQKLTAGAIELRDVIQRILEKQAGTRRFLLVVDQWEELYTHGRVDGKIAQESSAFIDQLLQATATGPLTVLLTLRADFMGDAIGYRPLSDRLQDGQVNLAPMNPEELLSAITQPAALLQTGFESGLAERIIKAVDNQPGHLPLVEFVLQRLWEAKPAGMLRHHDYEAMGELEGSIAHTADQVYQALPAADQPKVEKLFLQLVQISETAAATRRRANLAELDEPSRQIVRYLADARLLVTNEETVEVAHEALIHHWQLLRGWLDLDREFLLWRKRLQEAMEAWDKAKRDTAALLSGARLKEAERWQKQREDLTGLEAAFIRLGLRRQRKNRVLAAGLATALLLGVSFAGYVVQERITWRAGFYIWLAKAGIYYLHPAMVDIPGGSFMMGSSDLEKDSNDNERPQHKVTIQPFQMGRYEVTFDEYDVFSHLIEKEGGCADGHKIEIANDAGWGRGRQPVINVSWYDAVCYAQWLTKHTPEVYRLPSEAEWEYAARAGTKTAYWWGDDIGNNRANCSGCGSQWDAKQTAPVGSFPANPFGLHDTAGNVWEWVADCWHEDYQNAPADGSVWQGGDCELRVARGGSWHNSQDNARAAARSINLPDFRLSYLGFRLVCVAPILKH
ncbi:MAG: SUMF1/EgtB/PvdO family nonheme iron enzyme [Proteobacteria bacterium]|nr:SUMF1/EgtB/PvdO family nonheme iron enzyme [Pseudomonadota bacterium]